MKKFTLQKLIELFFKEIFSEHTFRSRGIRPSASSLARAARRFNIRLYCFALTYNGSSSVGSDALVVCDCADEFVVDKPLVCI
jgi:hypothetical protein